MKKNLKVISLIVVILCLMLNTLGFASTSSSSQNVIFKGTVQFFQNPVMGEYHCIITLDEPTDFNYLDYNGAYSHAKSVKELQVYYGKYDAKFDNQKVVITKYDSIMQGQNNFFARDYAFQGAEMELASGGTDEIKVIVNGKQLKFDQPPVVINNRTLVPVRAIFESLGCIVEWDGRENKVSDRRDNMVIGLYVGEKMIIVNDMNNFVNDNVFETDIAPIALNNRVLVPARVIAESLGCDVQWNQATKTVVITQ